MMKKDEFYYCMIQSDGNLVIYNHKHQPRWASNTWNKMKNVNYQLKMKGNGQICVQMNAQNEQNQQYYSDIWFKAEGLQKFEKEFRINYVDRISIHSCLQKGEFLRSEKGNFYFAFLRNGNLAVLDQNMESRWNSHTNDRNNSVLKVNDSGDLHLLDSKGNKVWSVENHQKKKGVYWLVIDNDGYFRIENEEKENIWNSEVFNY